MFTSCCWKILVLVQKTAFILAAICLHIVWILVWNILSNPFFCRSVFRLMQKTVFILAGMCFSSFWIFFARGIPSILKFTFMLTGNAFCGVTGVYCPATRAAAMNIGRTFAVVLSSYVLKVRCDPAQRSSETQQQIVPQAQQTEASMILQCVICLDAPVGAAITPCFHAAFCVGCANDLLARARPARQCPMCRGEVGGVQRIYLP